MDFGLEVSKITFFESKISLLLEKPIQATDVCNQKEGTAFSSYSFIGRSVCVSVVMVGEIFVDRCNPFYMLKGYL